MHCTNCTNDALVAIHLTIGAEDVSLYRCARCDTRHWAGRDGGMTRDGVLDLVRSAR